MPDHSFATRNPATGALSQTYPTLTPPELEHHLAAAAAAQRQWAATPIPVRAAALHAIAEALRAERAELGRLATLEMGKTCQSALAEADKCASACDWYAHHGADLLRSTDTPMPTGRARIDYLPLGTILAVMPWNFPFWQAMRAIAPALMAGNAILLKHAANVPQCALAIERLVRTAGATRGMPPAVFTNLFVDTATIADIIADDRVAAVTLTGSERAGMAVAQAAGRALKKCILELGGSDPFIVMPSANIPQTIRMGVTARMQNNGQSCVCAKRFIVHQAAYAQFTDGFVAASQALRSGDPTDPATQLGPLCTEDARAHLHHQVERAVAQGARILTGGVLPDGPGWFYPPTVLADLPPDCDIAREELFGPVAMLFKVASAEDALALANDVPFGLGSSVWTSDAAEAEFFIRGCAAGMTAINTLVASDPRVPFGGVKRSGYGRELAHWGMHEFVNIKTVLWA